MWHDIAGFATAFLAAGLRAVVFLATVLRAVFLTAGFLVAVFLAVAFLAGLRTALVAVFLLLRFFVLLTFSFPLIRQVITYPFYRQEIEKTLIKRVFILIN